MVFFHFKKNFINKKEYYLKNLFFFNFFLTFVFFTSNSCVGKTPEQLINESIAKYPGQCPCPYSIMTNGKKCGKRSAYSKPGGYEPLCYESDLIGKKDKRLNTSRLINNIRIIDGDTIHIDKIKYRLHGIDAPEMKQICEINKKKYNCGVKSRDFLNSLIGSKFVRCEQKDVDRYKRVVAECFVGNTNINKELVRNGWALAYKDYSSDYILDEKFASENRLGMWEGRFIHPKKWRKLNR